MFVCEVFLQELKDRIAHVMLIGTVRGSRNSCLYQDVEDTM